MEDSGRESRIKWGAPFWQLLMALERVSSLHPLAIIARKRLDITLFDFVQAIRFIFQDLLLPGFDREGARQKSSLELSSAWEVASVRRERLRLEMASVTDTSKASDAVYPTRTSYAPFLSVRTAFDLYLKALRLPRGSLVVCSPLTIPDMVTILCEHGLVPLPIDLDPSTLAPNVRVLETEVSKRRAKSGDGDSEARVRAIYVAHVFGAQVDIAPIAEVAARCDVLLWEDCAQMFTGLEGYLGHPKSDAVFFSFGVIKRATALGGGVARISDAVIMSDMLREEADYPVQPTMTYLLRVLKCFMLSSCTSPLIYGIIVHSLLLMGVDYDKLVMKLSKGFPKKGLLKAIRKRPSIPLVQMLAWTVTHYTSEGVEIRLRNCNRMFRVLDDALAGLNQLGKEAKDSSSSSFTRANDVLPGIWAHRHTLWLYPVMIRGRSGRAADYIVDALVDEGFDATRSPTSLMPIDRCVSSRETVYSQDAVDPLPSSCVPECSSMMDSLVYLPLSNNIPDSEMDRMMLALARALSNTSFPEVCRDKTEGRRGAQRARFRGAGRKIIAFMCRLDVVALSIFCAILCVAMTVVDFVLK